MWGFFFPQYLCSMKCIDFPFFFYPRFENLSFWSQRKSPNIWRGKNGKITQLGMRKSDVTAPISKSSKQPSNLSFQKKSKNSPKTTSNPWLQFLKKKKHGIKYRGGTIRWFCNLSNDKNTRKECYVFDNVIRIPRKKVWQFP